MTDDLVKRARDALDGVTPGPWWTGGKYNGREMGCAIIAANTDCGPLPGNPTRGMVAWASAIINTEARRCEADARFIAAARSLVPDMADRIEALEAENARLRESLSLIAVMGHSDDLKVAERIAYHAVEQAGAALTPEARDD